MYRQYSIKKWKVALKDTEYRTLRNADLQISRLLPCGTCGVPCMIVSHYGDSIDILASALSARVQREELLSDQQRANDSAVIVDQASCCFIALLVSASFRSGE